MDKTIQKILISVLILVIFDTCEFRISFNKEKYNIFSSLANVAGYVVNGVKTIKQVF